MRGRCRLALPGTDVRPDHHPACRRLWCSLTGRLFSTGDRLPVTITAPRRRAERIAFVIRNNRLSLARLL